MAKVYDPIMCMMVDKPDKAKDAEKLHYYQHSYTKKWYVVSPDGKVFKEFNTEAEAKNYVSSKAQDELSLAQKKQVVTELKGYLKKSYNFGDESEYARAYEDLRHMFTTGSRKSISGLFENTVKKTGAHDAVDPIQQRKHEIVVKTQNYLRSIGKSNSVGKFDRVVQGVKNLLYQGFLEGPELERAIKQEADRLIKKYNLDECPEGMTCDAKAKDSSIRGFFKSQLGKEFHKDFENIDKLMEFVRSCRSVGTKFIGTTSVIDAAKAKDCNALDEAIKTCDAASGDAMKQIASTAKSWTKQYNQLFEKATTEEEVNKLKSQKDNDYRRALDNLDKIYNEVSQAYGYARNEVISLLNEVDSNAFKAYRRVTQK